MNRLQARLRAAHKYEPGTGIFYRLQKRGGHDAGGVSGTVNKFSGYRLIQFEGKQHYAHRLAFLYMMGRWPLQVDHINGQRDDNRWDNLRECTNSENAQNSYGRSHNKSGVTGVHYDTHSGRWRAAIRAGGKEHKLGRFKTLEEAAAARAEAKLLLHPFQPKQRTA